MDQSLGKDISLLVVGVVAGLAPWLLDKAGYEMPRPVAIGCLVLCAVVMCVALSNLGWLESLPLLRGRRVSLSSAILAFCFTVAVVYWFGGRPRYQPIAAMEMDQVNDKQFVNESIEIDGKNFVGCTFVGVRLIYHGRKEFRIADSKFEGPIVIQTDSKEGYAVLSFVINFLRDVKMVNPSEVGFKNETLVIQKGQDTVKH